VHRVWKGSNPNTCIIQFNVSYLWTFGVEMDKGSINAQATMWQVSTSDKPNKETNKLTN